MDSIQETESLKRAKEWDESYFNDWIRKYPETEHGLIRERLKYIREYAIKHPTFDSCDFVPSKAAYRYYDLRDGWIEDSGVDVNEFYNLNLLQSSINTLGLKPEPTFEFIVYLWGTISKKNPYVSANKRKKLKAGKKCVAEILDYINKHDAEQLKLAIWVGSKKFDYENNFFIENLLKAYLLDGNSVDVLVEDKDNKRKFHYLLVKTLLDFIKEHNRETSKESKYTQAERTFSLCVLYLVKGINIPDINNIQPNLFGVEYNCNFDKLMRDYENYSPDFISPELFE